MCPARRLLGEGHPLQETPMILRLIGAAGLGAALMYFYDPASGRRRRALVRDQLVHAGLEMSDRGEAIAKDVANRAQGLAIETRAGIRRTLEPGNQPETR